MYTVISFDGRALNDGNFETVLEQSRNKALQVATSGTLARRGPFAPIYGGKIRAEHYVVLSIVPRNDPVGQGETLKQWLSTIEDDLGKLLVADRRGRLWYAYGTPIAHQVRDFVFDVTLLIPDGVFYSEDALTDSWSITSSGQSRTIAVAGNYPARPVIRVTPTISKNGGAAYKRFAIWRNNITKALAVYPIEVTGGGINTAALVSDGSRSNLINQAGGISAVATSIPIDTAVGGGLPVVGMGYVDSEQIRWTNNTGTQLTGVTRGIGGTVAATHADNAILRMSKILANGDDLELIVDGKSNPRFLAGMNSAVTKIWTPVTWKPRQRLNLKTAVGAGGLTELAFTATTTNKTALSAMPGSGYLMLDSEVMYYGGRDIANYKLTGVKRAQMGTSAAGHAANIVCHWIEHEIQIAYGNAEAGTPDQGDELKPAFDLSTSGNGLWDYTSFGSDGNTQTARWRPGVVSSTGKISGTYSGPGGENADPWTEMGLAIVAWQQSGVWKGETAVANWRISHPCGIASITASGRKYRKSADWPYARINYSLNNGVTWTIARTETTPATANSWSAWAVVGLSVNNATGLEFQLNGSITAKANNVAYYETQAVTLTLTSANLPTGSISAENGAYELNFSLKNLTSGDVFKGRFVVKLSEVAVIDCETKAIINATSGANLLGGLDIAPRFDWMTLAPGENMFEFVDEGTTGVNVVFEWRERA